MRERDFLIETALTNFEVLLDYWKLEWRQISGDEYDFKSPTRNDSNFGACRFNIVKARGADFAQTDAFTKDDYSKLGAGFTSKDFNSFDGQKFTKHGFDVIGLCQRVYGLGSRTQGFVQLERDLHELSQNKELIYAVIDAKEQRKRKMEAKNAQVVDFSKKIWRASETIPFVDSPADKYLRGRGITYYDPSTARCHPGILYPRSQDRFPALLLKVTGEPKGDYKGLHRIYIDPVTFKKAKVPDPKMVLGSIRGLGIWFGEPGPTLAIAEGPEESLTLLMNDVSFVVSTISSTNYHNLTIPSYVKELVLVSDNDPAGELAYRKARKTYEVLGINITRGHLE